MKRIIIIGLIIGFSIPLLSFIWPSKCLKKQKKLETYEAIIVLGNPANDDCTPGLMMMERLDKGIELYKNGVAKKLIFCGGKAANQCTESMVMRNYSIQSGVSRGDIYIDTMSMNTYQNAFNAVSIMRKNNLNTAAIVSSKFHTKRACGIFSRYGISYSVYSCKNNQKISLFKRFIWKVRESLILSYHTFFGYKTKLGLNKSQNP